MKNKEDLKGASAPYSASDSDVVAVAARDKLSRLIGGASSKDAGPAFSRLAAAGRCDLGHQKMYKDGLPTMSAELDLSKDCRHPKIVTYTQRTMQGANGQPLPPTEMIYAVRCRKCSRCVKANQNQWVKRAEPEFAIAARTWFVTITFTPDMHLRFMAEAGAKSHFDLAFSEVQKMFKRMRASGKEFRYLLTTEAHQSGWPHFHMLLHEKRGSEPIGNRELSGNDGEDITPRWWVDKLGNPMGFIHCRLVRIGEQAFKKKKPLFRKDGTPVILTAAQAAWYVCKYMGKSDDARVRASIRYGNGGFKGGIPLSLFNIQ